MTWLGNHLKGLDPKRPVIVGGDWNVNALADKGTQKWFPRAFFAERGMRRDTNKTPTKGRRVIDHIWARNVQLVTTTLLPKNGSDHRPLVCHYKIKGA